MAYASVADVKKLFPNTFRGDPASYPSDADIQAILDRLDIVINKIVKGPLTDANDKEIARTAEIYMAAAQLFDLMYTENPDAGIMEQRARLWNYGKELLEYLDIQATHYEPTSASPTIKLDTEF